ncbi:hypothetical protein OPV22_030753 [Ensete ventricosum]|uniref:Uncharacterized protein n=1 Tax=Ensete ventricosum TaxID=4639 RepID=A0AAV8PRN7_ENSVE|nr:hypothetical protein OPV22_030753 [Ensete ventricosum]
MQRVTELPAKGGPQCRPHAVTPQDSTKPSPSSTDTSLATLYWAAPPQGNPPKVAAAMESWLGGVVRGRRKTTRGFESPNHWTYGPNQLIRIRYIQCEAYG